MKPWSWARKLELVGEQSIGFHQFVGGSTDPLYSLLHFDFEEETTLK